jgi:hypothetical protein
MRPGQPANPRSAADKLTEHALDFRSTTEDRAEDQMIS